MSESTTIIPFDQYAEMTAPVLSSPSGRLVLERDDQLRARRAQVPRIRARVYGRQCAGATGVPETPMKVLLEWGTLLRPAA